MLKKLKLLAIGLCLLSAVSSSEARRRGGVSFGIGFGSPGYSYWGDPYYDSYYTPWRGYYGPWRDPSWYDYYPRRSYYWGRPRAGVSIGTPGFGIGFGL